MSAVTMKAVVCHGQGDYRLEHDFPRPKAGLGEIIIKVETCGICAGDVKCFSGADMFWNATNPAVNPPVIPGHEFWGRIVELGEGAAERHDVAMGDRVIAEQIIPCGKCRFCRSGKYWMCETHHIFGFFSIVADGGMAEYMKFPATCIVHKIPDAISLEDAAIIEPMACAIHAVQRGSIELDDVVVLAGVGPLGLCMAQIIPLKTPKKFIVIDMDDERLAIAKKFGADVVINPKREDALARVKEMTDGYGCDVYIEATGHPGGVTQGLEMIRKLGRFVEFGLFASPTTVDWSVIGDRKELDLRGAHLGPYCYEIAIDLLLRDKVTSNGIVTHQYHIDDFKEAMEMAAKLESIKVLINP